MQILLEPHNVHMLAAGVLNAVIALFFLVHTRRTKSTRLLADLFGLWALWWLLNVSILSLVSELELALDPLRIPPLPFALAVHLHFAYTFGGTPFPREARYVVPLGYTIAVLFSVQPLVASIVGLTTGTTPPHHVTGPGVYWSACILLNLWSIVVYLRKSVHFTREAKGGSVAFFTALFRPTGREARAQRALVLPWLIVLAGMLAESVWESASNPILSEAAGYVASLAAVLYAGVFVLVYLTFSPQPVSIRVKLSGAALTLTLALFAVLSVALGSQYLKLEPAEVGFPERQGLQFSPHPAGGYIVEPFPLEVEDLILSGGPPASVRADLVSGLGERLDVWKREWTPVAAGFVFPVAGTGYDTVYVHRSPFVTLGAPLPPHDLPTYALPEALQPVMAPLLIPVERPQEGPEASGTVYVRREAGRVTITWHDVYCWPQARNTVQITLAADGGFTFVYHDIEASAGTMWSLPLIGVHFGGEAPLEPFRAARNGTLVVPVGTGLLDDVGVRFRTLVHERLLPFVWILLITTAVVLVGFPLLLRTSLTDPIGRLLDGIRRIDEGERDVAVPVGAEDEVGRLTRYFNRMTVSLKTAEADLRAHAEHLEERVEERTSELRAEKEKSEVQAEALADQAERLAEQAERLRELDEAKSRFFANVSHELRTPLTLILGPLRDAASGTDRPDADATEGLPAQHVHARHVPAMRRSAERLLTLVDELLDLARLDAGRLRLRVAEHDLVGLTRRTVLAFASRAEREGLALGFDTDQERIVAWVDAERYERVISNLLTNALKFTPSRGRVRVMLDVDQDEGHVVLTVCDTGEGIRDDLLPHVFERFRQGDDAATRRHEGAGIGLALVRELVELHGGSVTVESEVGSGSAFTVRLPLGKEHFGAESLVGTGIDGGPATSSTDAAKDIAAQLPNDKVRMSGDDETGSPAVRSGATVLVVEDHDDMRAYLRDLLAAYYHVEEAANGEEGLETALRLAAEGRMPALVISDVMMPGMDGYALCRAFKQDEALGHVPFVLLTARADEESKLEGLGEGADDYLAKPFSAEELLARCENLIEVRRRLRARFSGEVVVRPTDVFVEREEADWLEEVKAICEERLSNSNFGVDWLADELGVSARTLRRRLKEVSGLSPGAFLRTLRLERAAQLLEHGAKEIGGVAAAVGYAELPSFSRAFRQGFGVPPSEYADLRRGERR